MTTQLNLFQDELSYIKNPSGNTKLVFYGIQNEESDYRAHVGVEAQHVYFFKTDEALKSIKANASTLKKKPAFQTGRNGQKIVTAHGYLMPLSYIKGLDEVLIPKWIVDRYPISYFDTQSAKGAKAVLQVADMLKEGLIKLPFNVSIIEDRDLQIKGSDISIQSKFNIQVKCDYRAGDKRHSPRATGNLYLQVAECNPFGKR